METYHVPVMLQESLDLLEINPDGVYVDLTFGGGGHSSHIVQRLSPKGHLYSFDQDADAEANAFADERFTFVRSNFRFMRGNLRMRGVEQVDGVFADLGVSSHHFDATERGFSFRGDAPLDMRMNRRGGRTAADVVNDYDVERLTWILKNYGEIDGAARVARCIESARSAAPLTTTFDLVEAVKKVTPPRDESKFLSKLFQAIRIEVNGEMEALQMALEQSLKMLRPGGRLVIMSYHSLEDRMVKNFMRSGTVDGKVEKDFYGRVSTPFEIVTRKVVVPTPEEVERNPRSRSAKMRAAIKL
ncbi:MAG: 16S rRNA (cytosine(1402)-N(4))-methyltransferase RsmH [Rikenellaceae bacterium]|jgi:16S rRNA (cytosine1402-N4)-methyltransferase|nr:16S rRNA (cytosine(1402)-N(4))-methyltransferase RsmH [Rikenellaceae bacterium]